MLKMRLHFTKTGRAKYISHLDLMRTFQRAFLRADIPLRHTEGFNPHPYLSFALPLAVGCESLCELLDFDLAGDTRPENITARLSEAMPEGIRAVAAYPRGRKFSEIALLEAECLLVYDKGVSGHVPGALTELFAQKELIVTKKTKKGPADFDIAPHVSKVAVGIAEGGLMLTAELSAQNPSVGPELLTAAIRSYRPDCAPDFAAYKRLEVYDAARVVFR